MIKKIKNLIAASALLLAVGAPAALATASASAQAPALVANAITDNLCNGANTAAGDGSLSGGASSNCSASDESTKSQVSDIAKKIVMYLSIVVGIVAVIMIVVGGFRYITSGGDSGKVGSAKNTIIYAIIGLVLVALAQIIVNVVLSNSSNISS